MVVGYQDDVHARQRVQILAGPARSPRSGEAYGAAALGPDRVGQHAYPADLHQKGRVADEGRRDLPRRGAARRREGRIVDAARPGFALPFAPPAADVGHGPAVWGVRVE